jgi:hypothetical protein
LKTTLAQASASSTGGPGPVHSFNAPGPSSEPFPSRLTQKPLTQAVLSEPFFGSFLASRKSPNPGRTSPAPVASTGGRSGHSGTLQGATGGTQTHSRRTGSKLGRLHCARQGLVRVPESNTKYGGKGGKTGVTRRPLSGQVSVSPQGFPSRKNCFPRAGSGFAPLFTGQLFIDQLLSSGTCIGGTHIRPASSFRHVRAGMPAGRWSGSRISGMLASISAGNSSP